MSKIDYTKPILERDYSELLGEEILYFNKNTINECFLAGIHPDKGISIVLIDDPDYEKICLNKTIHADHNYKGVYAHMISKIKRKKFINPGLIYNVAYKDASIVTYNEENKLDCAFK